MRWRLSCFSAWGSKSSELRAGLQRRAWSSSGRDFSRYGEGKKNTEEEATLREGSKPQVGNFEKHTRGVGRKIMEKLAFVPVVKKVVKNVVIVEVDTIIVDDEMEGL